MSYKGKIKWRQKILEMEDRGYLEILNEIITLREDCAELAKNIFYDEGLIRIPVFLIKGIWFDDTCGNFTDMKELAIDLHLLKEELEILREEQKRNTEENHDNLIREIGKNED